MTVHPSSKMSGRGLYVGVCPVTGCSWTTGTTTEKGAREALGRHLNAHSAAETSAAEQEKKMISLESLEGIRLKAAGIVVAIVAVLGLAYGVLLPGDQLPWVGPQDTVTVTVTTPQVSYPPTPTDDGEQ